VFASGNDGFGFTTTSTSEHKSMTTIEYRSSKLTGVRSRMSGFVADISFLAGRGLFPIYSADKARLYFPTPRQAG
jgi:hypothetical protein